ncbi:hypothetical protein CR205_14115 [Alteribacter lacisalsi]|uniref:Uncharacterized protein n=1 Tax=Alteribacter lacisalsi TaxID=2045244 RepID=A0A2W0H747_9BACI|nr:hypothetical protein [Alteribacter lacisalsi]PYZ96811.1 hypothetical protein CR205_14115 [Alteribacter lacisalsi]
MLSSFLIGFFILLLVLSFTYLIYCLIAIREALFTAFSLFYAIVAASVFLLPASVGDGIIGLFLSAILLFAFFWITWIVTGIKKKKEWHLHLAGMAAATILFIVSLASDTYLPAAFLFTFVGFSVLAGGALPIIFIGRFVRKKFFSTEEVSTKESEPEFVQDEEPAPAAEVMKDAALAPEHSLPETGTDEKEHVHTEPENGTEPFLAAAAEEETVTADEHDGLDRPTSPSPFSGKKTARLAERVNHEKWKMFSLSDTKGSKEVKRAMWELPGMLYQTPSPRCGEIWACYHVTFFSLQQSLPVEYNGTEYYVFGDRPKDEDQHFTRFKVTDTGYSTTDWRETAQNVYRRFFQVSLAQSLLLPLAQIRKGPESVSLPGQSGEIRDLIEKLNGFAARKDWFTSRIDELKDALSPVAASQNLSEEIYRPFEKASAFLFEEYTDRLDFLAAREGLIADTLNSGTHDHETEELLSSFYLELLYYRHVISHYTAQSLILSHHTPLVELADAHFDSHWIDQESVKSPILTKAEVRKPLLLDLTGALIWLALLPTALYTFFISGHWPILIGVAVVHWDLYNYFAILARTKRGDMKEKVERSVNGGELKEHVLYEYDRVYSRAWVHSWLGFALVVGLTALVSFLFTGGLFERFNQFMIVSVLIYIYAGLVKPLFTKYRFRVTEKTVSYSYREYIPETIRQIELQPLSRTIDIHMVSSASLHLKFRDSFEFEKAERAVKFWSNQNAVLFKQDSEHAKSRPYL